MALVALGVTGGIGAYKAVEICRGLQKRGHEVVAIMTQAATRFVGPITFEAITGRRVITDQWEPGANADIEHISIASDAALLLVAPATAHVIGRLALGLADDFLTSMALATRAPIMIAPAMNSNMLAHPAVQANLETLRARGVRVVEPGEGLLACGWTGKGRLAEPAEVVEAADRLLAGPGRVPDGPLAGLSVLVTAGPTYEDLDPVRYLGNRSSGRMGMAIAEGAVRRGAAVTLVLGPTALVPPSSPNVVRVRSAADMHRAVFERAPSADVIVMAAAVADYTPAGGAASGKIAKQDGDVGLSLVRTRDILADLGAWRGDRVRPVLVGFAAETSAVIEKARAKRARKRADLIVANDVSRPDAGFEVDTNAATLVTADDEVEVPLQQKAQLAERLLDHIEALVVASATSRQAPAASASPGVGPR